MNLILFSGYAFLIGYLSLQPSGAPGPGVWDKGAHFAAYAVFAVLAHGVCRRHPWFAWLCVGIVIYGGLLEYGQSFAPRRTMSVADFIANTLGVVVGGWLVNRYRPA